MSDFEGTELGWEDGVFLAGGPGIGKTHLACALLRAAMESGSVRSAYFTTAPGLLVELRSTYGGQAKEREIDVVTRYANYGALVLDDLGAEKITDWSASSMYLILNKRDAEMRPTFITSNMAISEIAQWEPRIASRLASMKSFNLGKADRRLEARKKTSDGVQR